MNIDNKDVKDINIVEYAKGLGAVFKEVGGHLKCNCLFHHEKTPSMAYNPSTNKLRCFGGCGKSWDIIDLCMEANNVGYVEAVEMLRGGVISGSIKRQYIDPKVEEKKVRQDEKHRLQQVKNFTKWGRPLGPSEVEYLKSRCIYEVAMMAHNTKGLAFKISSNSYKDTRAILYEYEGKNLIIKKYYRKVDQGKGLPKAMNIGFSGPVSLIPFKGDRRVMVVEGIEDGLSALAMGVNAIVLNGVGNTLKLAKLLEGPWAKKYKFIPTLDNDEAGCKHQALLLEHLERLNLEYVIPTKVFEYMNKYELKDLNDYLVHKKQNAQQTTEE